MFLKGPGTYSSLAYLRCFPFDKLKIDRSFITDLTTSPENLAIVRAIIGLGKSFGAIVTAEGVETEEQYACLAEEGCDQAQGFWLGRPTSAEGLLDFQFDRRKSMRAIRKAKP